MPEDLAVAKIQAASRGRRTRKILGVVPGTKLEQVSEVPALEGKELAASKALGQFDDAMPESLAATKMQAAARGRRDRQRLKLSIISEGGPAIEEEASVVEVSPVIDAREVKVDERTGGMATAAAPPPPPEHKPMAYENGNGNKIDKGPRGLGDPFSAVFGCCAAPRKGAR